MNSTSKFLRSTITRLSLMIGVILALSSTGRGQSSIVRLEVVNVPVDSGLLADLLTEFEARSGYRVEVDKRENVYDLARQGRADLVISHYGHAGVEAFMTEGLGLWPRAVFANQHVLIGPSSDPARIRGLQDAVEAFRRIAQTKSRFVVNNSATDKNLELMLWEASGRPERTDWFTDSGLREQPAIEAAGRMNGYVIWGMDPFLRFKQAVQSDLEALVLGDPLFRRVMVSIVVNPDRIAGINVAGAVALQKYLVAPATQARIRAFRYAGLDQQLWWPAGRDNSGEYLTNLQVSPGIPPDPAAIGVTFDPGSVRVGGSFTATFVGADLSAQTYFDVRFRAPGSNTDQVAQNWQQGTSGAHTVPLTTPPGTWAVTGVRVHQEPADHSRPFSSVSVTFTVLP